MKNNHFKVNLESDISISSKDSSETLELENLLFLNINNIGYISPYGVFFFFIISQRYITLSDEVNN